MAKKSSVDGAVLSFSGKVVVFVAEDTWTLITFVLGLIEVWLADAKNKNIDTTFLMIPGVMKTTFFLYCLRKKKIWFQFITSNLKVNF